MKRTCPQCGAELLPKQKRFCSRACLFRAMSEEQRVERPARTCPCCGKVFVPSAKHPNTRYCSKACANRSQALALPPRPCEWCGKMFRPASGAQAYCSAECRRGARLWRERNERQGFSIRPRGAGRAANVSAAPRGGRAEATVSADAALARVRAYLDLPPDERWARRDELTEAEHKLAKEMWDARHGLRTVITNELMH